MNKDNISRYAQQKGISLWKPNKLSPSKLTDKCRMVRQAHGMQMPARCPWHAS